MMQYRIIFELEDSTETLWAKRISDENFQIMNTPFLSNDVSYLDIVRATKSEADGIIMYDSTIESSGHSTFRIFLFEQTEEELFHLYWARLEQLGCSYERGILSGVRLFAVDAPPKSNIRKVIEYLKKGYDDGIWEFDEGHCGRSENKEKEL